MSHPFLRRITAVDQTAAHLREGIRAGRWKHHLPGAHTLAAELKVSRNTAVAAVEQLLADGTLAKAGARKPHLIVGRSEPPAPGRRVLRTALLLLEALEKLPPDSQREALSVIAEVKAAGHECVTVTLPPGKDTGKTGRLARLVRDVDADAWLVSDGSIAILQWFIAGNLPAFALGGPGLTLPIAMAASYDISVVGRSVFQRLIGLGHRRIVFICGRNFRLPTPSVMIHDLHRELLAVGVKPGEFHAPDWEETPGGLDALLKSLFRFTPPTAIVGVSPHVVSGVLGFLAKSGLAVPGDVSVVSLWHSDTQSEWTFPDVRLAHVESDDAASYRRIREWVNNVAKGRPDTRQFVCPARLVEGNTLGPAKNPTGTEKLRLP
jgi:DNA-binding LacI/PurR family transcriptional regulator